MSLLRRLDRVRDKDAGAEPQPLGQQILGEQPPLTQESSTNGETGAPPSNPRVGLGKLEASVPEASDSPLNLAGAVGLAENGTDLEGSAGRDMIREYYRHKHAIFDGVLGSLDPRMWQQPDLPTVRSALEKAIDNAVQSVSLRLDSTEHEWLVREFTNEIVGFGPITPFLDDPGVSRIIINGAQEVLLERLGQIEKTPVTFHDDDHLLSLIRRIAEIVGGRIDAKVPLLDRPLPGGARVRAKVPPLAEQPSFTLEKSRSNPFDLLKRQRAERQRPDNNRPSQHGQLRERIQQRLVRELEGNMLAIGDQDQLRGQVEELIANVIQEERVAMTRAERAALATELLHEFIGFGPLEPLLNDPEIDEIMVNGPAQIYVERRGKIQLTPQRFHDNNHVMQVIDRVVAPLGRRIDEKSPMVDGRLPDGSRFNAIIPPLSLNGPVITIRKFARDPFTMTDLINFGTISREAAQFLQAAVTARMNIIVSGGTGSGKTTTMNVLSSFISPDERIVTIEDAAELQMRQEHVIRLETRPPNIEGVGEVAIRDLVRNALRMRPDRIVVGECRGAEALDMLQAMNTGHDGSLTTAHANSTRDVLKRLETMVMMAGFDLPVRAIREQISMAINLVVHQDRMKDGVRRVVSITEIVGMEGDVITLQDIFSFQHDYVDDVGNIHGKMTASGLRPKCFEQILQSGVSIDSDLFSTEGESPYPTHKGKTPERALR